MRRPRYGPQNVSQLPDPFVVDGDIEATGSLLFGKGGSFVAGSISADSNDFYGVIIRAKTASPSVAVIGFAKSDGTVVGLLDEDGNLDIDGVITAASCSGKYTPTLTNTLNITSSSSNANARWMRMGNLVWVSMGISVRPAGAGTTALTVSLPIASNLSASTQLSGGIAFTDVPRTAGIVEGDAAGDTALVSFTSSGAFPLEAPATIWFSYEIL